jgi:hypothetical protein
MGRELTPRKKSNLVAESFKYRDNVTGKLVDGAVKRLSTKFNGVSKRTIMRILAEHRRQDEAGILSIDLSSRKKGRVGRKTKFTDEVREVYLDIIKDWAHSWRRLTHDILKEELEKVGYPFSKRTVQQHLKRLKAYRKNIKLKPLLTEAHKLNRLRFVLGQIDARHGARGEFMNFFDQLECVHLDESWIFLATNDHTILLCDGVECLIPPKTHHKSHIDKIMYLAAFARPRSQESQK